MQLFGVWNKNYKLAYVVADSIEAALTMAAGVGHLKRRDGYRKWRDLTDDQPADLPEPAVALLDQQKSGVVAEVMQQGWVQVS